MAKGIKKALQVFKTCNAFLIFYIILTIKLYIRSNPLRRYKNSL